MFKEIYIGIGAYGALVLMYGIIEKIGDSMKPKQYGMTKNKSKKKRKKLVKGK